MIFETLRFQMVLIDSKIVVTNSNQIVITIVFIEMQMDLNSNPIIKKCRH